MADKLKLTTKSNQALKAAITHASETISPMTRTGHILKSFLEQQNGITIPLLNAVNAPIDVITQRLEQIILAYPRANAKTSTPPFDEESVDALTKSQNVSKEMQDEYTSTEHILVGLASTNGAIGKLLQENGATPQALRDAFKSIRGAGRVTTPDSEDKYQALEKYAMDLTKRAREGKIDPVIGRDSETRRVVQILSRRTKNNPIIVGSPGTGKTAVVEGLAGRIVSGDVPSSLQGKTLMSLDMTSMLAGAKYRGDFEERLKSVLDEIASSDGEIITFIDEIHTIVGAGGGGDGAMDAGNIIKPLLARGELRLIGATTTEEYRQYIEKDAALARRFQQVHVGEPTVEDTIGILRGIKDKYEIHHGVRIADSALVNSVVLSDRYISSRFLPDKAIDLMDEAASRVKMDLDSRPEEIDNAERVVRRLEVEEVALQKETDQASVERLASLQEELADAKEHLQEMTARWQNEMNVHNQVQQARKDIENIEREIKTAEIDMKYDVIAKLQYEELPGAQQRLRELEEKELELGHSDFTKEEVGPENVAEVVSAWTGIPVGKMMEGETERLINMEAEISKSVVGQDNAVSLVSDSIRRSRAGIDDPDRPIGSFLFTGSTGSGKTLLTKKLAEFLFDTDKSIVRLDMSEFGEKHNVARLVGPPPGYVGYEAGGQLTEAVRRSPYTVVLLDEVEKAHPDVFDILLQVLDEGRLTDGQGRLVDFRNTVVILTSNLGAGGSDEQIMDAVKKHFKPEFVNRLDDIVIFNPLGEAQIEVIVGIQLEAMAKRLEGRRIQFDVRPDARRWLAENGYDPEYGARPLRRLIQKSIGDQVARKLLGGEIREGDTIIVDVDPVLNDLVCESAAVV